LDGKDFLKIRIVHPFNRVNSCKEGSRGHGSFISKFKLQTPNLPYSCPMNPQLAITK
jgi:hypothetical protein